MHKITLRRNVGCGTHPTSLQGRQGADSISTEPKASVVGASMRGATPGHGNVAHAECEQSIDIQ